MMSILVTIDIIMCLLVAICAALLALVALGKRQRSHDKADETVKGEKAVIKERERLDEQMKNLMNYFGDKQEDDG